MGRNKKWISILSNITFVLAIVFTAYLFINLYIIRKDLPPGVCPVDQNQVLMYWTIGLAVVSLVLSIVESRLKKR